MGKDYSRIAKTLYERGKLGREEYESRDWTDVPPDDEPYVKKLLRIVEGNATMIADVGFNVAASRQHEALTGQPAPIDPTTGRPAKVNPKRRMGQMTVGGYKFQALVDEEGRVRIAVTGDPWQKYKVYKAMDGVIFVLWPEYNIAGDPYENL